MLLTQNGVESLYSGIQASPKIQKLITSFDVGGDLVRSELISEDVLLHQVGDALPNCSAFLVGFINGCQSCLHFMMIWLLDASFQLLIDCRHDSFNVYAVEDRHY